MEIFRTSRAYRMVAGDAARGQLSHAYLFVCPDGRNLRAFLKELAVLIMQADERIARLIGEERCQDCRIFPAPGEKATVADVKLLLDECYIKPAECDRKLFVFDRVHEMLPPAQNKLLKILEEPPQNVYFLLGAESEFPVLSTVKSRTKRLELLSFPQAQLAEYIAKEYPHCGGAAEIAAMAGGVLGRAQSLAEEGGAAEKTEEIALLALNLSPAAVPAASRKYGEKGEAPQFLAALRPVLRDMLMIRLGRGDRLVSGGAAEILERAAGRYSVAALVRAQELIGEAERDLKFNANPSAGIEKLLVGILEAR